MNENKTSCAPADNQLTLWDSIDWTKAELAVRKLQARIVKAQKDGRHNKVKALQWTLTHSFYAKALAIKRVTSNGGGNTPGVDMETWDKPETKMHERQSHASTLPHGIGTSVRNYSRYSFIRVPQGTPLYGRCNAMP